MDVRTRNTHVNEYDTVRKYGDRENSLSHLTLTGRQRTESEGHPFSRIGKTGEDIGGNFQTERYYAPRPGGFFELGSKTSRYWSGPLWGAAPPALVTSVADPSESMWRLHSRCSSADVLSQRGTTAIANTTPTNPAFSAAAALGELREGLPSLPGKSVLKGKGHPKGIADEYLNFEFGVKPMLSDGRKLVEAHKKSEKILAQLYRDSGRLVRRRFTFPSEETTTTKVTPEVYPWGQLQQAYLFGRGTLVTTIKETKKYWFSGGYTYFFPKQEGWHRKIAELEKVYGVIPDAADLWQLTPWSWAVDWVSNTGDLIQNMTSFSQDSLVLRYGYIMCRTDYEVTDTWTGDLKIGPAWSRTEISSRWRYVSKQRLQATPYGFGFTGFDFSTRQKAIIAALGISRSGK